MTHFQARGETSSERDERIPRQIRDSGLYGLRTRFRGPATVAEAMQPTLPAAGLCSEKDHKINQVLWRVMLFRPTIDNSFGLPFPCTGYPSS